MPSSSPNTEIAVNSNGTAPLPTFNQSFADTNIHNKVNIIALSVDKNGKPAQAPVILTNYNQDKKATSKLQVCNHPDRVYLPEKADQSLIGTNRIPSQEWLKAAEDYIAKNYPENLLKAVGGAAALAKCPRLYIANRVGQTGYMDFISPKEMPGPIAWGWDSYKRPFLSVLFITTGADGKQEARVETLFQRYKGKESIWTSGGARELVDGPLINEHCATIAALIKGEPVKAQWLQYKEWMQEIESKQEKPLRSKL